VLNKHIEENSIAVIDFQTKRKRKRS